MRNIRGRLRILAVFLLFAGSAAFVSGCDSGTSSDVSAYSVRYWVESEVAAGGSALLDRVYYDDESGVQEVVFDPPEEGWSNVVTLAPSDTIYLRAEGTVASGRFVLQITVEADNGSFFVRTANNMPFDDGDFWVEIPRETLP